MRARNFDISILFTSPEERKLLRDIVEVSNAGKVFYSQIAQNIDQHELRMQFFRMSRLLRGTASCLTATRDIEMVESGEPQAHEFLDVLQWYVQALMYFADFENKYFLQQLESVEQGFLISLRHAIKSLQLNSSVHLLASYAASIQICHDRTKTLIENR